MTQGKLIEEDWRKAPGIKCSKDETNSALAPRDYSVKCHCPKRIAVIEGYFIWWCSSHHQPLAWCENGKLEIKVDELESKLEKTKKVLEE